MGLTESTPSVVAAGAAPTSSLSSQWMKLDEVKVKTVMVSSENEDDPDEDFADIIVEEVTLPSRHRSVDINSYFEERVERPLKDTFLFACQNSYILLDPRNIIVLGQTGAGKSSTICHLLGDKLPKHPTSTNLMEVPSGLYWISRNSNKLRKVADKHEIQLFKRSILTGTAAVGEITHSDLVAQQQAERKLRSISNPQLEATSSDFKSYSSSFTEDLQKAIYKEIMTADLKGEPVHHSPQEAEPEPLYQFIDCGGIPFFRNLLPQFFPSAEHSIFFVVHKLTDKLHHPAQIRVLKNGRLVHQVELQKENMEEISNWVKIAHSCSQCNIDGDHIGNTFIVGTHFDHLQQQCFNNKALALDAAYTATDHICESVINNPCHTVLDPKPVFLNNIRSGMDGNPCPGMQKLRRKLWQYKPPNYKPLELPIMWCIFIKRIREIANDLKNPVISLEEFFKISKAYYLSHKEAEEVLKLCEKYCLIFHLDSASYLSKFVFIDLQWLFASLANILKQPDSPSKRGKYYSDWKDLMNSGLMSVNFHAHLFFHTPQVDCLPSTWASDLLEQLHLISRVNLKRTGARFFCPILLPLTSSITDDDNDIDQRDPFHYNNDTDALYIIPQNLNIPPGYLARLFTVISNVSEKIQLVYCTSQKSATFRLLTDNSDESYFIRVSEGDKGEICLEYCNVFPNRIKFFRQRSIARMVLQIVTDSSEQLKKTFKLAPSLNCPIVSIRDGTKDFPTIFLKCLNKNCPHVHHLSRVFPQPLNKSKPFVECCSTQNRMFFSDLPSSQLIWLIDLIEDKFEVDQFEQRLKKLEQEVNGSVSCLVQTYPSCENSSSSANVASRIMLRRQQCRERGNSLGGVDPLMTPWNAPCSPTILTSLSDQLREQFNFDYYFNVLEDFLDLDICNYLFQYGVLNNDERSRILSLNSPAKAHDLSSQPHCRASAISMLMEIVKAQQCHGFVGFVTALEQTIDSTESSSHQAILDNLQKDKNFMKVKRNWLYSMTVW